MIRSMTAFAREQAMTEQGELVWELRSVNHRYLEVHLRLPEELRVLETVVRERLAQRLSRGKFDCSLRFSPVVGGTASLHVNERLVEQVLAAADLVGQTLHDSRRPTVMDVLRWPGVLEAGEQDFTPLQKAAGELLEKAIDNLIATREREGERLAEIIGQRVGAMREQVQRARVRMPQVIEGMKQRLQAKLDELTGELEPGRLEQEITLLAQRLDVDEEMDRLSMHLDEIESVLRRDEPVGRRLDFLMQELNREANTLGSKSADVETTNVSVEMKVLIEQMREQIQNLE